LKIGYLISNEGRFCYGQGIFFDEAVNFSQVFLYFGIRPKGKWSTIYIPVTIYMR